MDSTTSTQLGRDANSQGDARLSQNTISTGGQGIVLDLPKLTDALCRDVEEISSSDLVAPSNALLELEVDALKLRMISNDLLAASKVAYTNGNVRELEALIEISKNLSVMAAEYQKQISGMKMEILHSNGPMYR